MPDTPFRPGHCYRTCDGRAARIYATDGSKPDVIHGAVLDPEGWNVCEWQADGSYFGPDVPHANDLILTMEA